MNFVKIYVWTGNRELRYPPKYKIPDRLGGWHVCLVHSVIAVRIWLPLTQACEAKKGA